MMTFGRDHLFALDEAMQLRRPEVLAWLEQHRDEDLLVFGFTFMIWQDLLAPLREEGVDLSRATLVHSGGWKKLIDQSVSRDEFKQALSDAFGITSIHDFYGMVEQVGSVYFECEAGFFHPPNFADVIMRDPMTWEPAATGAVRGRGGGQPAAPELPWPRPADPGPGHQPRRRRLRVRAHGPAFQYRGTGAQGRGAWLQRYPGACLMMTLERPAEAAGSTIRSAIDAQQWEATALVAEMAALDRDQHPFDEAIVQLCAAISARLLALRQHPEAVSLGFWMRPASLSQMREAFERSVADDQVVVPRGLAFHVTPANVDTMFVYSWVLSLLVGNANIVRLSSRGSTTRTAILESIAAALTEDRFHGLASRNRFVLTEHGEATSRTLSGAADVRIVWGGNETVGYFRSFPLPVHGRDIVFPDRHSMAVLDAASVADLDDAELAALADRFFNDAFWFDQGACSSPRLITWQAGTSGEQTERAIRRFRDAVTEAIRRRHYMVETGMTLNKMAFATEVAARVPKSHIESTVNEAYWVRLSTISDYSRDNCGGGLFFEVISDDLDGDLMALVGPRDQTVTTFGLDAQTLRGLARHLNGRGVDRFVPVGQALAFGSVWDGLDLLHELSKRVVVDAARPA